MKNKTPRVNSDQFINISTKEIAYLLGFLWADGYIVKNRNEIRLEIVNDDLIELFPLLDKTGSWNYSVRNRGDKPIGLVTTFNKEIHSFLIENDYDKKSYISADKILAKIPDDLKHYFFRGLIDGDGCFYLRNIDNQKIKKTLIISGSHNQDWSFVSTICDELNLKHYIYQHQNENSSSSFEMNGENAKLFGDYIYTNRLEDNIGLTRKYIKYQKLTDSFNMSKRKVMKDTKSLAIELYHNGMSIVDIIKTIPISSTTLRRLLKGSKFTISKTN
jgi:hypothetical protein